MWTHIADKMMTARKEHRCCLCGHTIPKGIKYSRRTGVDGQWIAMHMHEQCERATHNWKWDEWEIGCDEWTFCHEVLLPETLAEIERMEKI